MVYVQFRHLKLTNHFKNPEYAEYASAELHALALDDAPRLDVKSKK